MIQKHTPGPWHVTQEETWPFGLAVEPNILHMQRIAYSSKQKTLMQVRSAEFFNYDERDAIAAMIATQEANAHLIAAAPDLFAALKGCIDSLEFSTTELWHEIPNKDMEMMMDRVANARAAIAKAEGETNE